MKRWQYLVCVEGLVAGLGRTTVVFTGDTESVVENLQLRQQKQKGRGEGKKERREQEKKKVRMSPRKKGGGKNEHHKYSQGQHITITTAATVSSFFWCSGLSPQYFLPFINLEIQLGAGVKKGCSLCCAQSRDCWGIWSFCQINSPFQK